MKKIVSIQDISCFGKCSLTVALPVVSAMGVECAIIPTAVLSTHTGGFTGYTFRDLTDDIEKIADHWESIPLSFDAVYTGYLSSAKQVDILLDFFNRFGRDSLIFVDPAMGDKGKLYAGFSDSFPKEMAKLCAVSDVTVPNLTEACAMLGIEYIESGYNKEYIENILHKLRDTGAKNAVLTGVSFSDDKLGIALLKEGANEVFYYFTEKIPRSYHGTGDLFSSCCVGALTRGMSLEDAISLAADFTVKSIKATYDDPGYTYSVKFEKCIPYLVKQLEKG